ncbi:MAG TPA: hypothetical protein V6C52_01570 [Coleofasciculaceae cyanobacterium]
MKTTSQAWQTVSQKLRGLAFLLADLLAVEFFRPAACAARIPISAQAPLWEIYRS